jgi:hypothetical protein
METDIPKKEKGKFKNFLYSVLNNLIVSIVVLVIIFLFTFILGDFKRIVKDVPNKIDSIDSILKITTNMLERNNYKEGFKPLQAGVVFNRDNKNPIPNEQITILKHKNNPIENIDKIKGKYIYLKSNNRENPVWTRLLITRISENPKDMEQDVDIFVNDETAKLLTTNTHAGNFTVEYKLDSEEH